MTAGRARYSRLGVNQELADAVGIVLMPRHVLVHVVAVAVCLALQWAAFSVNALVTLVGLPILLVWGSMVDLSHAPERVWVHRLVTWAIAASVGYVPLGATLAGVRLWWG